MKKMKNIAIIIIGCMLLNFAYGCSKQSNDTEEIANNTNNGEYIALEVGNCDADDGGNHKSEFTLWPLDKMSSYHDSAAGNTCTVSFNGKTYTGHYENSCLRSRENYVSHLYSNGSFPGFYFWTNADTGEFSGIWFVYTRSPKPTISEEQCKSIADQYAKDYIDLNEYEVETTVDQRDQNYVCYFDYYRKVDGYKTSDSLSITIDGNGNLAYLKKHEINAFKNTTHVAIDESKAITALETKLTDIYADVTDPRNSYEIKRKELIKLDDGRLGIRYVVDYQFIRCLQNTDIDVSSQDFYYLCAKEEIVVIVP